MEYRNVIQCGNQTSSFAPPQKTLLIPKILFDYDIWPTALATYIFFTDPITMYYHIDEFLWKIYEDLR